MMPSLHTLLVRSSRTFAVGIEALPEPLRAEITVAYLLLRVSDYLEDNQELDDTEKVALLQEWRHVLGGGGDRTALIERLKQAREDTPDALVARHTATVLAGLDRLAPAAREILVRRVRESSAGMARWTDRGSVFETEEDLDDYMHEVAGRVGHLLTELFALRLAGLGAARERMMRLGREFGLALQTVNVIRGLHEDRERGWIYVPAAFLPEPRIDPRNLFDPSNQAVAHGGSRAAGRQGGSPSGGGPGLHPPDSAAAPPGAPLLPASASFRGAHPRHQPFQPGCAAARDQDDPARGHRRHPECQGDGLFEPLDRVVLRAVGGGRVARDRAAQPAAQPPPSQLLTSVNRMDNLKVSLRGGAVW